ncbi:hypothetical protein C2E20_2025 [Micractinium conductrix]|uniref:Glycosyltransferase family 92 protein n=1 Tax=Micractinium conductrix TaxID=554055 RepID=A0A2P6VMB3_9CHLO|nr:hypothetical protein C2E20_2025 [Micractinium conductrix]PSC75224.1 hypothetical protein C2E20_2025 [Micractinium conductrix]|eukprot:PSC75223.1 hypothetical protein C2E20_2025 [Micractinium conductrix]
MALIAEAQPNRRQPVRPSAVIAALLLVLLTGLLAVHPRTPPRLLHLALTGDSVGDSVSDAGDGGDRPPSSAIPCNQNEISNAQHISARELDLQRQRDSILARSPPRGGYLAGCLVVKDQHEDLPDWLDYHAWLGFSHFYVMDDGSDPPLDKLLKPYIRLSGHGRARRGLVTHRRLGNATHLAADIASRTCQSIELHARQVMAYSLCLHTYGHRHRFMSFFDADEYLVIRGGAHCEVTSSVDGTPDLPPLLRDYEGYGALAVTWRMFGSNGHLTRQPHVLSAYTSCLDAKALVNSHIKTIANTARTTRMTGPHTAHYAPGFSAVTASRQKVQPEGHPFAPEPDSTRLALHHYVLKSRSEYEEKMARSNAMDAPKDDSIVACCGAAGSRGQRWQRAATGADASGACTGGAGASTGGRLHSVQRSCC